MNTSVTSQLQALNIGTVQQHGRLTIYPIFDALPKKLAYIGLSSAIKSGLFCVTETSARGTVPYLKATNKLDENVLLVDGEELIGSKQNRVLNTSILVAAHSELMIPVSCTEQGRWRYTTPNFSATEYIMPASHRHEKARDVHSSLEAGLSFSGNQGAVWSRVADLNRRLHVSSDTGAMHAAFIQRDHDLKDYMNAFAHQSGQKGLVVSLDGQILGLDFISDESVYREIHPKLLNSYAMESVSGAVMSSAVKSEESVSDFITRVSQCTEASHKSVGPGFDLRYSGNGVLGSALLVEDEVVHLSMFNDSQSGSASERSRMVGFQHRRSFR